VLDQWYDPESISDKVRASDGNLYILRRQTSTSDGVWDVVHFELKTSQFKILTRRHTSGSPPSSCEELTEIALKLRERIELGPQQRYRLVGIGLSNFRETVDNTTAQPVLFG
jgi:nucleotidyltransferase/DNA polymerase involved in DNA repair